MKRIESSAVKLALLLSLLLPLTAQAQGSLSPPAWALGTNGPIASMKTLSQVEPRTHISELPFTITESGSFYLTKSITYGGSSDGITVAADDVEIDLNGFALNGSGAGNNGIMVQENRHNVTIRNGVLRDWSGYGLAGQDTWESRVVKVTAFNNASGGLKFSGHCHFEECGVFKNSGPGIVVGEQSTVVRSKALDNQNGATGIVAGNNCRVVDCDSARNGKNGIEIGRFSVVTGCTTVSNANSGIYVGPHCRLKDNLCAGNDIGINLVSNGCRVEGNQVAMNNIGIQSAGQNLIVRNSGSGNASLAFPAPETDQMGETITGGGLMTTASPWSNFEFTGQ